MDPNPRRHPNPDLPRGAARPAAAGHASTTPTTSNARPWVSPVRCGLFVAGLIGVAVGMTVHATAARLTTVFDGAPTAHSAALAAAVVALAVGLRVPQRLAVWLCAATWHRFLARDRRPTTTPIPLVPKDPDLSLYWTVLSVIGLAAGVLTALQPAVLEACHIWYAWLRDNFLWSWPPLVVVQCVCGFVAVIWPCAALGLCISCVHHVSCAYGRWNADATAWILAGVGAGLAAAAWLGRVIADHNLLLLAAAVPALLAAIASAASSARLVRGGASDPQPEAAPLPIWSDRWPTLLRAGVVCVGLCGAAAVAVWLHTAADAPGRSDRPAWTAWIALGAGVLAGNRTRRSGLRSIGGFGVACTAAGVVVMGAMMLRAMGRPESARADALVLAGLSAVGFAAAYGQQVLLNRVASRSLVGSVVLTRIVGFGALVVWVGAPAMVSLLGGATSFALLALSLVAVGGMLIIHEPHYSRRTRRARLCGVFAAIAFTVLLMPPPERGRVDGVEGDTPNAGADGFSDVPGAPVGG